MLPSNLIIVAVVASRVQHSLFVRESVLEYMTQNSAWLLIAQGLEKPFTISFLPVFLFNYKVPDLDVVCRYRVRPLFPSFCIISS